jgi:DNA end-binding protein Ku
MARVIWKGALSFGLVHVPVSLLPATVKRGIDFDWLDKRTMDPVGYKRINKATGKDITGENIVRGVQYEKNRYIVLSDDEIRAAYPEATQTVDIVAFVAAEQIPLLYIDTPYYLKPENRGEKVYALLREALKNSGRVGLAKVVLHSKQHLAVVVPLADVLVLDLLRWGDEVRSVDEVGLTREATGARLGERELEMAERLIADMEEDWDPARYKNEFAQRIGDLVERKATQGKLEAVAPAEPAADGERGGKIIDLADLLRRSLKSPESRGRGAPAKRAAKAKPVRTAKARAG